MDDHQSYLTADDERRTEQIVTVLDDAFAELAAADPEAFRGKFRKMAAEPFAFYRGSACLFYADVAGDPDRWADERTGRVWIQGDLHAENFGTYMDGSGHLVFDVNDFDEAFLGHFTWDLQRLVASVALLGWGKALPDDDIERLLDTYLRAYLDQVEHYASEDRDHAWSLRLGTARGAVEGVLQQAQLATRIAHLEQVSRVEDYDRRLREGASVRRLDDDEYDKVARAYERYLDTIPEAKRLGSLTYRLKDAAGKRGIGIGSAGLPTYSLLVEGHTEALENDVVLTMKQGQQSSVGRVGSDARLHEHFLHAGHRTALSQRALQAYADPWLGWTELDGTGFVVKEFSPYEKDLDWSAMTEPDALEDALEQLGRATAKVHCVSDADSDTELVSFQVEDAIVSAVQGKSDEFVADLTEFALRYAGRVRRDHHLFVEAFRAGRLQHVGAV